MRKPRTLVEAMDQVMKPIEHMYPTVISEATHKAMKQAEREHAPNVAVRMNSRFMVEYYNTETGEIVSCHY